MSPRDHAEDLAKELVNNHARFGSFAWFAAPEDSEKWCLVYTHNRDSDCLDESNAAVIARELGKAKYEDDVRSERHSHWAVGWVEGYAIRVYDDKGEITPAFLAYSELHCALAEYPVLDEDDFSEREQAAAFQTWQSCFNDRERLTYMREHKSQFECLYNGPSARAGCERWREILDNVRGRDFGGYASELIS